MNSETVIELVKLGLEKNTPEALELVKTALNRTNTTTQTQAATPFEEGGKYYIRTVTYHMTGRVKAIINNFLVLTEAAWIADSGRFRQAIMDGVLDEVEPVDVDMYVNINSITDAFIWTHALPREQK